MGWSDKLPDFADDSATYVAIATGTLAGVIVDFSSAGVTLGQGTMGGGAAGLAVKAAYDLFRAKKRLRKRCNELIKFYTPDNMKKVKKLNGILSRIDSVKSEKIRDIDDMIRRIDRGK